jgi:hypothetical protein
MKMITNATLCAHPKLVLLVFVCRKGGEILGCTCYVALSVKEFRDRYVFLQAGEHTMSSHAKSSGILNPKQRVAVDRAARSAPLALGTQIHTSMQNFSPGRHIPYDRRSRKAVDRLVRKTRRDVMSRRVGGIDLDGSEGAMNQLAESL